MIARLTVDLPGGLNAPFFYATLQRLKVKGLKNPLREKRDLKVMVDKKAQMDDARF